MKRLGVICLAGILMLAVNGCTGNVRPDTNLIEEDGTEGRVVNLFGPMEKSKPNAENASRNAFDRTVSIAEERLGLRVEYRTYTAENYTEKTYDDVVLDRARNNMDDLYLLNPDTIQILGEVGMAFGELN